MDLIYIIHDSDSSNQGITRKMNHKSRHGILFYNDVFIKICHKLWGVLYLIICYCLFVIRYDFIFEKLYLFLIFFNVLQLNFKKSFTIHKNV